MYNNQKRVELVKRRIYERNCQQQRHGIYGLSAACMVLFAFLAGMLHVVAGHTQMAAQGMYGSVLLYKDAGTPLTQRMHPSFHRARSIWARS